MDDFWRELSEKLLTQCGLVTALQSIAIIWLAGQLAKARAGWEADRATMARMLEDHNASYDRLSQSNAKLEGMITALSVKR